MPHTQPLHPSVARAFEEIDAAMFSGDEFHNPENMKILMFYMGRWMRGLPDCLDIAYTSEEEDGGD